MDSRRVKNKGAENGNLKKTCEEISQTAEVKTESKCPPRRRWSVLAVSSEVKLWVLAPRTLGVVARACNHHKVIIR